MKITPYKHISSGGNRGVDPEILFVLAPSTNLQNKNWKTKGLFNNKNYNL